MIRVAVVDVGSNAIRLVWQAVDVFGEIQDEGYHRYGLRLGTDAFSRGKLGRQTVQDLISVFHEIASLLRAHRIDHYRAVATAAMRTASNRDAVVKRIKRETGIELVVIDGVVESGLSRKALVRAVGGVSGRTLLVDLGGGSLELERADGLYRMSTPLGTVRLMKRYPELSGPMSRQHLLKMLDIVHGELRAETGRRGPVVAAVGSGGNLDALSRICPGGHGSVPMVDLERLPVKLVSIAAMTIEERMQILGLRADRADIIVAAGLVVAALHRAFGVESLMVPGSGMREALLNMQTGVTQDVGVVARQVGLRGGVRKLRQKGKSLRYVFEKLAPAHRLHDLGFGILQQASVVEQASCQGLCFEQIVARWELVDELVLAAIRAILAGSTKAFEHATEVLNASQRKTVKTLRGIYQISGRLSGVLPEHWPEMYIEQEVLALRVPGDSDLMRWQFTAAAKTMGLGLLFAHGA